MTILIATKSHLGSESVHFFDSIDEIRNTVEAWTDAEDRDLTDEREVIDCYTHDYAAHIVVTNPKDIGYYYNFDARKWSVQSSLAKEVAEQYGKFCRDYMSGQPAWSA